jgi:hypothetical protein
MALRAKGACPDTTLSGLPGLSNAIFRSIERTMQRNLMPDGLFSARAR